MEDIARAVRRRFGTDARLDNVVQPTLGGSNRTVVFDVVHGGATRRLVSRQETFVSPDSPFLASDAQFEVLRLVFAAGLRVPEPVFAYDAADAMGAGFVSAFVAGEADPRVLLRGAAFAAVRPGLVGQLAEALALLHGIDVTAFGMLGDADPVATLRAQLDLYREPHPAIELGLRWLELNRLPSRKPVVVHGDFRTGNFLVDGGGLAAVLDWECCHLGDAAEDLGWFCTRSWRFGHTDLPAGGFGSREALRASYLAAGGVDVTLDEIRYWEIFGLTRWAVLNVMQAYGHVFEGRSAVTWAACGRNTALIEYDLLLTPARKIHMTAQHRPDVGNLLATVAAFLNELAPGLQGEARYHARVSVYLLEICQREIAGVAAAAVDDGALAAAIRAGARDGDWAVVVEEVLAVTRGRVLVTKPEHVSKKDSSFL